MAAGEGIITRKEIITDEALAFGTVYRKNVDQAIEANKILIDQFKTLFKVSGDYRKAQDNFDYRKAKQEESVAHQKILNELKQLGTLERELEKIKKQKLTTERELLKVAKEQVAIAMQKARAEGVAEKELEKIKQERIRTEKELARLAQENEKLSKLQSQTEQNNTKEIERLKQLLLKTERDVIKLKQDKIRLEKMEADQVKRNTTLTMEERVQQQLANKAEKEAVLEKMGLIGAYQKLNKQRTEAKKRLLDLIATGNASNKQIRQAQKEFDILDKKIRRADQATGDFTKNVGNYKSAFAGVSNILGAFGIIGGVTGLVQLGKSIYSTTKQLDGLYKAMGLGSKTSEDYASNLKFLDKITEDYGLELISTTQAYNKFYSAAKNKLSIQEIQLVFDKVSKSASLMGMTVEQQDGTFKALADMMSKGTVMAEELKGQLGDRIPVAVEVMAKALGVGTEELLKMMQNGEVMAADVLPKFAVELEKAVGADQVTRVENLTASEVRLKNAWTYFIKEINGSDNVIGDFAMGFLDAVTSMVEGINRMARSWKSVWDEAGDQGADQGRKSAELNYMDFDKFENQRKKAFKDRQQFLRDEKRLTSEINKETEKYNEALKNKSIFDFTGAAGRNEAKNIERLTRELNNKTEQIKVIEELYNKWKNPEVSSTGGEAQTDTQRKKREAAERKAKIDREKAQSDADKAEEERLKNEKELYEAEIDLLIWRANNREEILKNESINEKNTQEERYEALMESQQLEEASLRLNVEKQLTLSRAFQEDKKAFTETEIQDLIDGKEIKNQLSNEEILILEKFYAAQEKLRKDNKKGLEENVKFEVKILKKQIEDKQKLQDTINDTSMNNEIQGLSYNPNDLSSIEAYEKAVVEIKKKYLKEGLENTLAFLEQEILLYKEGSKERIEAENKIANVKTQINEFIAESDKESVQKSTESAKEMGQRFIEMGENIKNALVDLTNAIFDNRIQRIDEDIERTNEQYEKQIELYEGDAARQKLIREQQEREREKLEAKKRKEQHKQAVFNKAMSIMDIGFSTAMAIMQGYAQLGPIAGSVAAVLISVLGTIQTAAVLATPIPKYKMGRDGGPEEMAIVGDGGVHEVIEHKDGSAEITPKRDTLVKLLEGDKVHSSIEKYRQYRRNQFKNDMVKDHIKMQTYMNSQTVFDGSGLERKFDDLISITKKKTMSTVVNIPKIDMSHELWKMKQLGMFK